jgi:hypothetical protein
MRFNFLYFLSERAFRTFQTKPRLNMSPEWEHHVMPRSSRVAPSSNVLLATSDRKAMLNDQGLRECVVWLLRRSARIRAEPKRQTWWI